MSQILLEILSQVTGIKQDNHLGSPTSRPPHPSLEEYRIKSHALTKLLTSICESENSPRSQNSYPIIYQKYWSISNFDRFREINRSNGQTRKQRKRQETEPEIGN